MAGFRSLLFIVILASLGASPAYAQTTDHVKTRKIIGGSVAGLGATYWIRRASNPQKRIQDWATSEFRSHAILREKAEKRRTRFRMGKEILPVPLSDAEILKIKKSLRPGDHVAIVFEMNPEIAKAEQITYITKEIRRYKNNVEGMRDFHRITPNEVHEAVQDLRRYDPKDASKLLYQRAQPRSTEGGVNSWGSVNQTTGYSYTRSNHIHKYMYENNLLRHSRSKLEYLAQPDVLLVQFDAKTFKSPSKKSFLQEVENLKKSGHSILEIETATGEFARKAKRFNRTGWVAPVVTAAGLVTYFWDRLPFVSNRPEKSSASDQKNVEAPSAGVRSGSVF